MRTLKIVLSDHCPLFLLSTRHIFFMHVKEDLHNGHLRMGSEQAEELSALLAQAEFGDYNQNTAQYWYSELCGEEPSTATIDRYDKPSPACQRSRNGYAVHMF